MFPFSSVFCAKKKWGLGRVVDKKTTPSGQDITPYMVQKLYCERYMYIQSMLGEKRKKN